MTTAETTTTEQAATVAAESAHVAPEKAAPKKAASPKKDATKGRKTAKSAKTKVGAKASKKAVKPARKSAERRGDSKGAAILALIQRPKGATLAEIMKATDWQAHSVRGFVSTAAKKHGVTIESAKNDAGERAYRITKQDPPPGRCPLAESKSAKILALIARAKGATLGEIRKATDWQARSVLGLFSDMGLAVTSTKFEDDDRRYTFKS